MEKKIRHSHQRDAIYRYLCSTKEHPSAEMVYESLRGDIPALSLGTVYRNLKLLEELGQVRRVASYHGTERYDACCSDHVHFLCEQCGRILDLEDADVAKIRSAVTLEKGCQVFKLDLTLTGRCPHCAAALH